MSTEPAHYAGPHRVKATPTRGAGARKLGSGVPGRLVGVAVDVPGGIDVRRRSAAPRPGPPSRLPRPPSFTVALREFLATEIGSGLFLAAATVSALLWANSPWGESYERLWSTEVGVWFGSAELSMDLRHWVDDGLMALFFLVVGLEVSRELTVGELRDRRTVGVPVIAAIGGMILPAVIFLLINGGGDGARGWGIGQPRVFRTVAKRVSYAATCRLRYSSWISCGVL